MVSKEALAAIHGTVSAEDKIRKLDRSQQSWWCQYADRKNDEDEEAVADSLLYDRNTLPRSAPAPISSEGVSAEVIRRQYEQGSTS